MSSQITLKCIFTDLFPFLELQILLYAVTGLKKGLCIKERSPIGKLLYLPITCVMFVTSFCASPFVLKVWYAAMHLNCVHIRYQVVFLPVSGFKNRQTKQAAVKVLRRCLQALYVDFKASIASFRKSLLILARGSYYIYHHLSASSLIAEGQDTEFVI